MRTAYRLVLLVVLLFATLGLAPSGAAQAAAPYPECATPLDTKLTGVTPEGAQWVICVPPNFNGAMVIYAHGYESSFNPVNRKVPAEPTFANLYLGDVYLPAVIESQGFAFGATTYRRTGYVANDAVEDVAAVAYAARAAMAPLQPLIYVAGVSEGGLVTTLSIEQHPELYAGGLATCGPIGSLQMQIDHFAGFRTLYDYFFPDVLPGNTLNIPTSLMTQWLPSFRDRALNALALNPVNAGQLMSTSGAAFVPEVPLTVGLTTEAVLWYNVYATEDFTNLFGGKPYDNTATVYSGSLDDTALNLGVHRYKASPEVLARVAAADTTGQLTRRLVVMHTTGDPVVPFGHVGLYGAKAAATGSAGNLIVMPVPAYGHCNFTLEQVLAAFGALVTP